MFPPHIVAVPWWCRGKASLRKPLLDLREAALSRQASPRQIGRDPTFKEIITWSGLVFFDRTYLFIKYYLCEQSVAFLIRWPEDALGGEAALVAE